MHNVVSQVHATCHVVMSEGTACCLNTNQTQGSEQTEMSDGEGRADPKSGLRTEGLPFFLRKMKKSRTINLTRKEFPPPPGSAREKDTHCGGR